VQSAWPGGPWAIAVVNVVGCFGFGLCFGAGSGRWSPVVAAAVLVGFFGAFTTFSSFAAECHAQLAARQWLLLLANVLLQNVVGIAALAVGIALGKAVVG
jgi:CrcB protein